MGGLLATHFLTYQQKIAILFLNKQTSNGWFLKFKT